MPSFFCSPEADPARPEPTATLTITVDDTAYTGVDGQTLAGVLLASGVTQWRQTSAQGRPRGLFCGIGVCFDCIATVNGVRDVRLCQRRAVDGDRIETQHDTLPRRAGQEVPDA